MDEVKIPFKLLLRAFFLEPEILTQMVKEHGDVLTINTLNKKFHVFANPEYIKYILNHPQEYMRTKIPGRKADDHAFLVRLYGEYSLITVPYDRWKKDRAIFTPLFGREKIKEYIPIMTKTMTQELDSLNLNAEKGIPINIDAFFSRMILCNVLNILFCGNDVDPKKIISLTRETLHLISPLVFFYYVKLFNLIPMPLYFRYRRVKREFKEISELIIKQAFAPNVPSDNIIKYYANAYDYQTFDQLDNEMKERLHSQIGLFLIAGHDTTSALLGQACVLLAQNPQVLDKMSEEVQSVLNGRMPVYDDLQNLRYTQAVVQETLRLRPPTRVLARRALKDDHIHGCDIKKYEMIIIPMTVTQMLPNYWDNPQAFNPSRFLQPLTIDQKMLFMPFGLGEHACIGKQFATIEATIALVMLAQRYRLTLTPGSVVSPSKEGTNRLNTAITMNVNKESLSRV